MELVEGEDLSQRIARGAIPLDEALLWAFGAVLCEMLSGRRAFSAADVSETLAAPPTVVAVLRRCLQKNAKQRMGDMQDGVVLTIVNRPI